MDYSEDWSKLRGGGSLLLRLNRKEWRLDAGDKSPTNVEEGQESHREEGVAGLSHHSSMSDYFIHVTIDQYGAP